MALDFDPAKLPPLPAGWTRDYFFYADGFEKDLDFYAAHAFTVEPLPHHGEIAYPYPSDKSYPADATHQQYQLDYNTRSTQRPHAEPTPLHLPKIIPRRHLGAAPFWFVKGAGLDSASPPLKRRATPAFSIATTQRSVWRQTKVLVIPTEASRRLFFAFALSERVGSRSGGPVA